MPYFAGLDIGLQKTALCVVDDKERCGWFAAGKALLRKCVDLESEVRRFLKVFGIK